jgi:hypothetical protein
MGQKSKAKKDLKQLHEIFTSAPLTENMLPISWFRWEKSVGHEKVYKFICGTVDGIFTVEKERVVMIGIGNMQPGNGHITDVFQWFERACRELKKNFWIVEIINEGFYRHLVEKHCFQIVTNKQVIKRFR